MTKQKKEKPKYSTFFMVRFMFSLAWKNSKIVIFICLATVTTVFALTLAEYFIVPMIISRIENRSSVTELLLTIGVFTLLLVILNGLKSYLENNSMFGRVDIRSCIINLINSKFAGTSYINIENPDFIKKYDNAKLSTNGNDSSTEAIWDVLCQLATAFLGFIFFMIMLTNVNFIIIAILAVTSIVSFFVEKHFHGWSYRNREEHEKNSLEIGYIMDRSENEYIAKDIRIFCMQDWINEKYNSVVKKQKNFIKRRELNNAKADVSSTISGTLRNLIAYFYVVVFAVENKLPASEFLLYFAAVNGFSTMFDNLIKQIGAIHRQGIELSTINEYLNYPEVFKFETDGVPLELKANTEYEIELKNVSFRYPEAEKDTISNVNLTIKQGEKLAVVGLNGAGKTTLVKLICGLYDPTDGEILLNGENIKQYNRRDYYNHFSAVFQNFSLLDVTIEENIACSLNDINSEEVSACLEKAGLTNKINSLEKGVKSQLGRDIYFDGLELSGGETQRILLARALYKKAPIIILDEPTAALDPLAESDMYDKYNEMTSGKTAVYISHRLASTRFCDRIILLEKGAVAEVGTHESLLKKGGIYAHLFSVQSKYYQ